MTTGEGRNQVKSKQRVEDHGEVLTSEREVNAMLDLVKNESERIESRFLEPACGDGNFLAEVLRRKLSVVKDRYRSTQLEYERNAILAISSIYGIDILEDNAQDCRNRLFQIFKAEYSSLYKNSIKQECLEAAKFLLQKNIIWGNALDLKTANEPRQPIIFSEWSPVNGSSIKRRDFRLSFLVEKKHQMSLFSDEGQPAHLDIPVRDFAVVHFLEIQNAE